MPPKPSPKKRPRGPETSGGTPEPMTAGGDSRAWRGWSGSKANHVRIGTSFLEYSQNDKWVLVWTEVPEKEMCCENFFGSLAIFLSEIYVIDEKDRNGGQRLHSKTAVGVWSGLIDQAKHRFCKSTNATTQARLAPACAHAAFASRQHAHAR